jgi:DNA polymerase-3 subunit beta
MKLLKINREIFLPPLLDIAGIVEKRHTLPILSNVLISATGNTLSFIATDLEIQITVSIALLEETNGFSFTVAAKKLLEICKALPEKSNIEIEQIQDHKLSIKAGKSHFNLQTLPAEDFPRFTSFQETSFFFDISQGALKKLLHRVMYAMAQQDIRYYLNGLLLVIREGKLIAIATDGHRLALADLDMKINSEKEEEMILPRKTIVELYKLIGENDNLVRLTLGNNQASFMFDETVLVSKIIDGKFPDYNKVIPIGYSNEFIVERSIIQQALQRASILSNEKFRGVRLVLTQNSLRIICTNSDQEEAQEEIEIDYKGNPIDIGFNVTYLLDALSNIEAKYIKFNFNDANSSGLITLFDDDSFKYVVMPMRI